MEHTEKKTMIEYMDVAKALGIIAVVMGHSGFPSLEHFVNLYHMSLFFFISGFFYKNKYTKDPITLIKKRLVSLYRPFVIYETIFLLLHNFFFKINVYGSLIDVGNGRMILPYDAIGFIKAFLSILLFAGREPMAGVFWFFTTLFFVNIIFCLLSYTVVKLFKNNREYIRAVLIILLFIFGSLTTKFGYNIPRFNNSLVMVLIFYFGYLFKRYEDRINTENPFFAFIALLLLCTSSIYGSVAVGTNIYLSPDFLIVSALLGAYINIYISKYLVKKNLFKNPLIFIGENTVIIMALQFISFKPIAFLQLKLLNLPANALAKFPVLDGRHGWWILYALAGVIFPLIVQCLINYVKKSINKRKIPAKMIN